MEVTNYYAEIGKIIKELREKQNMTKTQLAADICSVSYITRIENGERCPTSVILRQLTNKLGVHPEHLFRAIESPTSLDIKMLINQLNFHIERDDYKSIQDLLNNIDEKNLEIASLHDLQNILTLKCVSQAMLSNDYEWGLNEIERVLKITYSKDSTPTDVEFALMFHYGFFLLLNNKKEEAYCHLKNIRKHMENVKYLSTYAIFAKYYVYLTAACLDTSNYDEALIYINEGIEYSKKHNVLTLLRELYFLKGELYHRLNNEDEFRLWFDKSLTLHELTKHTDNEYFEVFMKNRLKKIQQN